ncbi:hypothetical protein NEHOM01_0997 [Nematocida homosporus]|uniref:uncharacterized protein n=1 Tax=Nematocida homosporus TaxID=1912981 RepID=UPI00221FC9F1|nr:uncharacterized protein NEHOM01_0997 [Nematocida homosporus]KAI5185705.1 hypothetical protein NEHOM01_0997 [Nematocida homosporus]
MEERKNNKILVLILVIGASALFIGGAVYLLQTMPSWPGNGLRSSATAGLNGNKTALSTTTRSVGGNSSTVLEEASESGKMMEESSINGEPVSGIVHSKASFGVESEERDETKGQAPQPNGKEEPSMLVNKHKNTTTEKKPESNSTQQALVPYTGPKQVMQEPGSTSMAGKTCTLSSEVKRMLSDTTNTGLKKLVNNPSQQALVPYTGPKQVMQEPGSTSMAGKTCTLSPEVKRMLSGTTNTGFEKLVNNPSQQAPVPATGPKQLMQEPVNTNTTTEKKPESNTNQEVSQPSGEGESTKAEEGVEAKEEKPESNTNQEVSQPSGEGESTKAEEGVEAKEEKPESNTNQEAPQANGEGESTKAEEGVVEGNTQNSRSLAQNSHRRKKSSTKVSRSGKRSGRKGRKARGNDIVKNTLRN